MKKQIVKQLLNNTNHKNVIVLNRGNDAIYAALEIVKNVSAKNIVLIPDQGGWLTYPKYPPQLGFEVVKVKTVRGVIDLVDLEEKAKNAAGILFSSFAGYFAEQPITAISNICKENNCLVIEDACGSLGDETLCNGNISDIIIGSFGRWKVVEARVGGFISFNNEEWTKFISKECTLSENDLQSILLAFQMNKLDKLLVLQAIVKSDLKDVEILHINRRGINVVTEKHPKVLEYCKEKGYEITKCPRYIRVEEEAYSIELKRLPYENI
jgi:hypothetical protein